MAVGHENYGLEEVIENRSDYVVVEKKDKRVIEQLEEHKDIIPDLGTINDLGVGRDFVRYVKTLARDSKGRMTDPG